MRKKLLAALVCAMLLMTLLPATAFADNATSVWIWGIELTSATPYYHNGSAGEQGTVNNTSVGANATFVPGTGTQQATLTLNHLDIRNSTATKAITIDGNSTPCTYAIFANGDLTIRVTASSEASTGAAAAGNANAALCVDGDLTFTGPDRLVATAGKSHRTAGVYISGDLAVSDGTLEGQTDAAGSAATQNAQSFGVNTMGDVTVSGGTLIANGNTATALYNSMSAGIGAGDVTVSGGKITVAGNTATAAYALSYGLVATSLDMQDGNTTANGNTSTGGANGSFSAGVAVRGDLSVSGGTLTTKGGYATATGQALAQSSGIYAEANSFSFSGGTVKATGGESGTDSCGIKNVGAISVSGTANVEAKGGTANENSYGVFADGDITTNGGSITSTGGEAKTLSSYGVNVTGNVIANGGSITAKGGNSIHNSSFGVSAGGGNSGITVNGGSVTGIGGQGASGVFKSRGIYTTMLDINSGRLVGNSIAGTALMNMPRSFPNPCYWRTEKSDGYTTGMPTTNFQSGKAYVDIRSSLITFTDHPDTNTVVTAGSITGNLTAVASVSPGDPVPALNWYACSAGGTIAGDSLGTGGTFTIPTTLTAGTYYYRCQASCLNIKINSDVASVTVVNAPEYEITKGQNGEAVKGGTEGLGFTANGKLDAFTGVSVDGQKISDQHYTAQSGSTIVTLKASYLKTLSVGRHTLRINYTDGYAETTFTILADIAEAPVPETGDDAQPILWLGIALVACVGFAANMLVRRKRLNG